MVQTMQSSRFMYGPQTSAYATVGTRTTVLPKVQSFDPTREQTIIYGRGLGEGLNPSTSVIGAYNSGGAVTFDVVDFDFLKHWVGPLSGAGSSGDHYILTEATSTGLTSSDLQVFSFEDANTLESTNTVDTYVGCVGTSFSLSGAIGTPITCTANFVARHDTMGTSATSYTPSTTHAFTPINGVWKWGSTPSTISGVQSFTINYDNGLLSGDQTRSIESRFQQQPQLGGRSYTGDVTIFMTQSLASTIIADFYGQTASSGPIDGSSSVNPTANLEFKIELVNGSRYATIWLDQCSIDSLSKPVSLGGGMVLLTFNFTAREGRGNVPIEWWS